MTADDVSATVGTEIPPVAAAEARAAAPSLVSSIDAVARSRLLTVGPDALLAEVAALLSAAQISLVVVCDESGAISGVITETILVRQLGSKQATISDAGFLDAHGHLKIIDRVKDVGRIKGGANDGAMFAPKYVENKLKFFPHIKEVVAFGDGRDQVCVMVNIDANAVGNWAERRNLPYAGYTDLAQKPEVYQLIRECVEQVNADLSQDSLLAGSQVSRFLVLHKELDADDGELTRTNKVRRGFIAEKYQPLVDALYAGRTEQHIETVVKFEDGRTGSVSATLKISDAKTFAPVKAAA